MIERQNKISKTGLIEKTCILLLFLSVSFSICYWAIAKYDVNTDYAACGDAQSYIKMSQMNYENVRKPFRYRILMPSLVYILNKNLNLDSFLNKYYENVENKKIQLNFGIINILSLTFAGFLLFYYCLHLGFNKWEGLAGAFLFFTSFFVVNYYSVPMVDSMAAFFIIACFYALLKNSMPGLMLAFLFGVFAKETTFIVIPLIVIEERRIFSRKLLYCLPGIILYSIFVNVFRYSEGWTISKVLLDFDYFFQYASSFFRTLNLYFLIEAIQTFMFLWVLFLYAFFKCTKPVFIRRALWLLIFPIIAAPIAGTPVVGRVAFFLFPIVIPCALLALRKIFTLDNTDIVSIEKGIRDAKNI